MNNVWEEITAFRILFLIVIILTLIILAILGIRGYILLVFALLLICLFILSHTFIQRKRSKQIEEYYETKIREGKIEKDAIGYFRVFLYIQDIIGIMILICSLYVLYLHLNTLDFKINVYNIIGLVFIYTNTILFIYLITIRKKLIGNRKQNIGFILSSIFGGVIGVFLILIK